jgi:hypothetical protein
MFCVTDKLCAYLEPKRNFKPNVFWVHGSTGTRKTSWAHKFVADIYKKKHIRWWDGYDKHDTILINDFR